MSTCRSCDKALSSSEMGEREVNLEDGTSIWIEEDMCKGCRDKVFVYYTDSNSDVQDMQEALPDLPKVQSNDWDSKEES